LTRGNYMQEKRSYYELLKHPLWQKKRLEIMQRNGFSCEKCGSTESTLNVHHEYYKKGLNPWEYPDESLHCLCEDCHLKTHNYIDTINKILRTLSNQDLSLVLGYVSALNMCRECESVLIENDEMISGVADFYQLTADEVRSVQTNNTVSDIDLILLVRSKG
jgi:hypothetical protein